MCGDPGPRYPWGMPFPQGPALVYPRAPLSCPRCPRQADSRRPTGAASSAPRRLPRGPRRPGRAVRAYWYPIYALIRRKGHGPEDALDLAQDYFARLLEKGTLAAADPVGAASAPSCRPTARFFLADRRDRDGP